MADQETEKLEKLLELFTVGREFTEDLIRENRRLKERLQSLERGEGPHLGEAEELRRRLEELNRENRDFQRRFEQVEDQNRDFAIRCSEVEEQNSNLASLYVASYQLHSTLDFREVIQIVEEILVNLVGAQTFTILLFDEEKKEFRSIASEGLSVLSGAGDLIVRPGEGIIGEVGSSGQNYFERDDLRVEPDLNRPIAVVPLKINEEVIGVIAVFSLFEQKTSFTAIDYELFSLLAAHAAAAIFSSRLYSQSERKLNTIQSFLDLLTT